MGYLDIHIHHRWRPGQPRPDFAVDRLKALALQAGIDRVLVLTLALEHSPEDLRAQNDTTLKLMREDPAFWLGAMYLSPLHEPAFIRAEAHRCAEAGFVAIKQHMDLFADDPRQDPISDVAAELEMPIVFHAWYKQASRYPNESNASHIAALARRHPDTRYVMAHLTGNGRRGVQDIVEVPNVSVDTSGGYAEADLVEYAVRHLGPERVVYGSDYGAGRDFIVQVARVLGSAISETDKRRILVENAEGLLKLPARVAV